MRKRMKKLLTVILSATMVLGTVTPAYAAETEIINVSQDNIASGTVDEDYGNVTWVIDSEGKLTVTGTGDVMVSGPGMIVPWYPYRQSILAAEINMEGTRNAKGWFEGCSNMTSVDFTNFDTSNLEDWGGMFRDCSSLTELDLSDLDTSAANYMGGMFSGCSALTELDLRSFDTSNVTYMGSMFCDCYALTKLNLCSFDTSNVTGMGQMFMECRSLENLDLSCFDTSNVTDMQDMFSGCWSLTELDLSNFNTSNLGDGPGYGLSMYRMFDRCSSLTKINVSSFDTSSVGNMDYLFGSCDALNELNLSNFDMQNVASADKMLAFSNGLEKIEAPINCSIEVELPTSDGAYQWIMPDRTVVTSLPQNLTESVTLYRNEISSEEDIIANGVIDEEYGQITWVIDGEGKLTVTGTGDVRMPGSGESVPWASYRDYISTAEINVTGMRDASELFASTSFDELDLSGFDTTSVVDMSGMFYGCQVQELDLSTFNTTNVGDMSEMFCWFGGVEKLDLSSFDTTNVTDMDSMFCFCGANELDLSSFDMRNVKRSYDVFWGSNFIVKIEAPVNCFVNVELPTFGDGYLWHLPDGTVVTKLPQGLTESVTLTKKYEEIKYEAPSIRLIKENGIADSIEITNNATHELSMNLIAVSEEDDTRFYWIRSYDYFKAKEQKLYSLSGLLTEFSAFQNGKYKLKVSVYNEELGQNEDIILEDFSVSVSKESYPVDKIDVFSEYNSSRKTFFIPVTNLPDAEKQWYAHLNPSIGGNPEGLQITDDGSQFYCYAHGTSAEMLELKYLDVNSGESEVAVNVVTIPQEKIRVTEREFSEKNIAILDYDHYMSFVASGGTITFEPAEGTFIADTAGFKDQTNQWNLESFIKYVSGRRFYQIIKNLGEKIFKQANLYWTSEEGAFAAKALYDTEGNEISKESISEHDIVLVKYEPEIVWVDSMELTAPEIMEFNERATIVADLDAGQDKYPFGREPQIRYESNNPQVVTVDAETGVLKAGTVNGSATITAYVDEDLRAQEGLDEIVTAGVTITVSGAEEPKPPVTETFTDVKPGEWYIDAVQYVFDNGIMGGNKGVFNPNGNISREQVIATLYNMENSPKVDDYAAVNALKDLKSGQWYTDAICWAYNLGVAQGNASTKMFGIGTPITREQLATMLYNYAAKKEYDTETRKDYSALKGAKDVSSYAVEVMRWAYGTGLIGGNNNLNPKGYTTRAQMASILMNFRQKNNI